MEKIMNIEGMMCGHCEARVKNALKTFRRLKRRLSAMKKERRWLN